MKKIILNFLILSSFMKAEAVGTLIIEGVVKVKGSVPHTYIVIEESKTRKNYKVANAKEYNLENLQNQSIRVKVLLIKKALGAGFPAVVKIVGANK